jgi:hypothetical protein
MENVCCLCVVTETRLVLNWSVGIYFRSNVRSLRVYSLPWERACSTVDKQWSIPSYICCFWKMLNEPLPSNDHILPILCQKRKYLSRFEHEHFQCKLHNTLYIEVKLLLVIKSYALGRDILSISWAMQ